MMVLNSGLENLTVFYVLVLHSENIPDSPSENLDEREYHYKKQWPNPSAVYHKRSNCEYPANS